MHLTWRIGATPSRSANPTRYSGVTHMTTTNEVLIAMSKIMLATVFGAVIALTSPAFGVTPETPATLLVTQEEPGFFGRAKEIIGKTYEAGKEKLSAFRDPDDELRYLRQENESLKQMVFKAERVSAERRVMQAVDYDRSMSCLENIGSVLRQYRPSILNPAPVLGVDTTPIKVPEVLGEH